MGVFSFLSDLTSSKKTEDQVSEAAVPAPTAAAPDAPAAPPAAPAAETPFVRPPAWELPPDPPAPPAAPATAAPASTKLEVGPLDPEQTAALQSKIVEAIKTVYDPEIPVDIYELGLIYDIIVDANRNVLVNMTLTSPACPSAQQLPAEVKHKVRNLPEVTDARVEIVWEPTWGKERMSEAAKLALGMF